MLDLTIDSDLAFRENQLTETLKKAESDVFRKKEALDKVFKKFTDELVDFIDKLPPQRKHVHFSTNQELIFSLDDYKIIKSTTMSSFFEYFKVVRVTCKRKVRKNIEYEFEKIFDFTLIDNSDHNLLSDYYFNPKYKNELERIYRAMKEEKLALLEQRINNKYETLASLDIDLEI